MRTITKIILHCTATPEGKFFDKNDVDAWHKQRGWAGIGYHFLILLDGTIQTGRPIEQVGAHVKGQNTASIGIAYVGGCDEHMNAKDTRTLEQKEALQAIVLELQSKFPKATIHGHNEFANKACPSFVVADEFGSLNNKSGQTTGIWGRGDKGDMVKRIQMQLNTLGYTVKVDGDFGLNTDYAVRQFQEFNDITIDGLVGEETAKAMFKESVKQKPMRDEREFINKEELKKTSTIMQNADVAKKATTAIAAGGGVMATVDVVKDRLSGLNDSYSAIKDIVEQIAAYDTYVMIGLVGLALYSWLKARKIEQARLNDHRTGKTV